MSDKTNRRKLPGKTKYSGRRRPTTRTSGYSSHPDVTGGEYKKLQISTYSLKAGECFYIMFRLPQHKEGEFVGFGGWFSSPPADFSFEGIQPSFRKTLKYAPQPDWGKVGSMWISDGHPLAILFVIEAVETGSIAIWNMECGVIDHPHLAHTREGLRKNMYIYSPEAHFFTQAGTVEITIDDKPITPQTESQTLYLKSCNRCARFLPINITHEQQHLSFTNHCTASHRVPCSHGGFGTLVNTDDDTKLKLYHGFQLECRFCKKFEVNAAHNPQRTAAQMKEDSTRRRAIERLLEQLYGASPQLLYRYKYSTELTDDIWERFNQRCFNCGVLLQSSRSIHLDHTRPLALLWPLDETATALCEACNTDKRDRPPTKFYSYNQLQILSEQTNIPLQELLDPTPNIDAINRLIAKIDWFFDDFLTQDRMTRVNDGKVPAELLVKALQKTLNKCPDGAPIDLMAEYKRRLKQ